MSEIRSTPSVLDSVKSLSFVRRLLGGRRLKDFLLSTPEFKNPERLRETLSQLVLIRVLILSVLLSMSAWQLLASGSRESSSVLFAVIGLTYGVSVLNALWIRRVAKLYLFGYVQLAIDVLLATLAIYVTSSLVSISLYLLIIVAAALLFSRHGAVVIAAFSGLCYSLLATGLLPDIGVRSFTARGTDILGVYVALVGIAVLSGYFAKQLEAMDLIASSRSKSLDELSKKQTQLFNDISDGVITLDLSETITGINEAARAIIGLAELQPELLVGKPLGNLSREFGVRGLDSALSSALKSSEPGELTLQGKGDAEVHLSYSVRTVSDSEGNESGRMLIFNDVSHVKSMQERLALHERMTKLLADTHQFPREESLGSEQVKMIGESEPMKQVFSLVMRIAESDASALITGESGTGKELIAKAIHANGARARRPFVAINCGAIPENLIESELFGHKKGSFTGAIADNPGLFREADGGTVFLDEVGELPVHLQTKLLRILQERQVRPVGDTRDYSVNVRIIAATNKNLKNEISANRFREDLYYRLNVVGVALPPLRERREDIPLLVQYFSKSFKGEQENLPQISPEALSMLTSYAYPGNVRELENIIERALVLGGHAILPEHLPEEVRNSTTSPSEVKHSPSSSVETEIITLPVDLETALESLEREYLQIALEQSGGVKKHAAELLGLNFRSFRYRLKKYGMNDTGD